MNHNDPLIYGPDGTGRDFPLQERLPPASTLLPPPYCNKPPNDGSKVTAQTHNRPIEAHPHTQPLPAPLDSWWPNGELINNSPVNNNSRQITTQDQSQQTTLPLTSSSRHQISWENCQIDKSLPHFHTLNKNGDSYTKKALEHFVNAVPPVPNRKMAITTPAPIPVSILSSERLGNSADHVRQRLENLKNNIKMEAPPCDCLSNDEPGLDRSPVYTHLGSAASLPSLRNTLENRLGLKGEAIRIEKLLYTGKEGKTSQGCPIAKWIIRRSGPAEKVLLLVKHREGHACSSAWIVVVSVAWEGVGSDTADDLYKTLVYKLTNFGLPTERRCGTNDQRTCACQGVNQYSGASFSFGCSWSMYYNGCKFARSKAVRKFRLSADSEEPEVEEKMQTLATNLAPVYLNMAPDSYNNQIAFEELGRECRLGRKTGRPWSGVTACVDFCAHSHKDVHNMNNGCTVIVTLTKHRGFQKPEDEQLHVLPLYILSDSDEFGSKEGQRRQVENGGLEILRNYPMDLRFRTNPLLSCRKRRALKRKKDIETRGRKAGCKMASKDDSSHLPEKVNGKKVKRPLFFDDSRIFCNGRGQMKLIGGSKEAATSAFNRMKFGLVKKLIGKTEVGNSKPDVGNSEPVAGQWNPELKNCDLKMENMKPEMQSKTQSWKPEMRNSNVGNWKQEMQSPNAKMENWRPEMQNVNPRMNWKPEVQSPQSKTGHWKPEMHNLNTNPTNCRPEVQNVNPQMLNWKPELQNANPQTLNWKPEVQNVNPQTQNWKPEVQNVNPQTQNWKPEVQNVNPQTQNWKPEVQNVNPQTQNWKPEVQNVNPQTQNWKPEVHNVNPQIPNWKPEMHSPNSKTPHWKPEVQSPNSKTPHWKPEAGGWINLKPDAQYRNNNFGNYQHLSTNFLPHAGNQQPEVVVSNAGNWHPTSSKPEVVNAPSSLDLLSEVASIKRAQDGGSDLSGRIDVQLKNQTWPNRMSAPSAPQTPHPNQFLVRDQHSFVASHSFRAGNEVSATGHAFGPGGPVGQARREMGSMSNDARTNSFSVYSLQSGPGELGRPVGSNRCEMGRNANEAEIRASPIGRWSGDGFGSRPVEPVAHQMGRSNDAQIHNSSFYNQHVSPNDRFGPRPVGPFVHGSHLINSPVGPGGDARREAQGNDNDHPLTNPAILPNHRFVSRPVGPVTHETQTIDNLHIRSSPSFDQHRNIHNMPNDRSRPGGPVGPVTHDSPNSNNNSLHHLSPQFRHPVSPNHRITPQPVGPENNKLIDVSPIHNSPAFNPPVSPNHFRLHRPVGPIHPEIKKSDPLLAYLPYLRDATKAFELGSKVEPIDSYDTTSPESPNKETGHEFYEIHSDNEENFVDGEIGGVAIALSHGSVLFECAKHELHASTALKQPNRLQPSRIALVFYQHKNMNFRNHGEHEYEMKKEQKKMDAAIDDRSSPGKKKDKIIQMAAIVPVRHATTLTTTSLVTVFSFAPLIVTGPYQKWIEPT